MKIILEFDSFQEMVAYCQRVVGSKETPAPADPAPVKDDAAKKKAEAAAKKKAEAAAKKKAEEEAAAEEEDTSSDDDGSTEVEVTITMEDIQGEVDRIRKLGRAATLKIRKYLDDNGIERIGEMDEAGYPDLFNFLVGVKK